MVTCPEEHHIGYIDIFSLDLEVQSRTRPILNRQLTEICKWSIALCVQIQANFKLNSNSNSFQFSFLNFNSSLSKNSLSINQSINKIPMYITLIQQKFLSSPLNSLQLILGISKTYYILFLLNSELYWNSIETYVMWFVYRINKCNTPRSRFKSLSFFYN